MMNHHQWGTVTGSDEAFAWDYLKSLTHDEVVKLHGDRDNQKQPFVHRLLEMRAQFYPDCVKLLKLLEVPELNIYEIEDGDGNIPLFTMFDGMTLLENGHSVELINFLIDKLPDINHTSAKTSRTTAHYAAFTGHLWVVDLLVSRGADIMLQDAYGDDCEQLFNSSLAVVHDPELKREFQAIKLKVALQNQPTIKRTRAAL